MSRSRIFLALGIVLALGFLLACSIVIAAVVTAMRPHYTWEATSPPAPDTLSGISRLTICQGTEWSFEVTDPSEIASFAEFVSHGTYEFMDKSGYGYLIRVDHSNGQATYYNHGDELGPKPGGFRQVVFVPTKPGFRSWFEGLIRQHGHERLPR